MASGHNRWSIHSLNTANHLMLETHRGTPHVVINDQDAAKLNIADNEEVRGYNDQGEPLVLRRCAQQLEVGFCRGFDRKQIVVSAKT